MRLTQKDELGRICIRNDDYVAAAEKLYEYENTDLPPEEIKKAIEWTNAEYQYLKSIIDLLYENNGWIPCSKLMPKAYTRVLIQDSWELMYVAHWDGECWKVEFDRHDPELKSVAWRPKPKPYKEET